MYVNQSALDLVDENFEKDNCLSKSEFIENAIRFYVSYLSSNTNIPYLSTVVMSTMEALLKENTNRLSKLLFKLAVELAISLSAVQRELNEYQGNIWTVIISLRREDAERLDYNNGARWRDMLRSKTLEMAKNLKINIKNLRWYAAFHNESHHPHVHLIVYSTNPKEGYLAEQGIENLRSAFAREIFAQDLVSIYARQTESRDKLRADSKSLVAEIVSQINSGDYDNPMVEKLLRRLSDKLSRVSGKKQYGYLVSAH